MKHLDSRLRQLTGYRMRRAMLPVLARVNDILAPLGLRRPTFSALIIIGENPGMQQVKLAELLAMEKPNLVQVIDDLEAAGFVERRRCAEDRRANALFVTDLGERIGESGLAKIVEFEAQCMSEFSAQEIETFQRMLDRVGQNARQSVAESKD